MAVLIVPEKKHFSLLEERLTLLEKRLNNLPKEIGEVLPEALYLSTDPTALGEALQTPVDNCVKQSVQKNPQHLVKALSPAILPFLRKVLSTVRKPILTSLQTHQDRLIYLEKYLDNLDQALVSHQAQLTELSNGNQTTSIQQSQLDELTQWVSHLKNTLQALQHTWQTQLDNFNQSLIEQEQHVKENLPCHEMEQHLNRLQVNQQMQSESWHNHLNVLKNQQSQLEQYFDNLDQAVVQHETQLSELKKNLSNLKETIEPRLQQLEEVDKYIDNLEKVQVNHHLQLTELAKQVNYFKETETYIDKLEKIQVNQHWQLSQLEEQVNSIKEAFKPVKESLQIHHTQLDSLEQSIDNLEKIRISQHFELSELDKKISHFQQLLKPIEENLQSHHLQLSEVDQYLHNLEQAQVTQHSKLTNLGKQLELGEQNQIYQQKQLTKQLDDAWQIHQTHLEQLSNQLAKVENFNKTQSIKLKKQFQDIATRYQTIEQRVSDPQQRAADIAAILPEAIREATQQITSELTSQIEINPTDETVSREEKLAFSMQRPVEICIQQAIKKDVRPFANALFPLIGPTIRRSIGEAFKELFQRINMILSQSILSRQGLTWRIQAWRTNQSFAEIVLSNTLAYRVEQSFLIHRQSGLLILHAHLEEISIGDSDAVSAMFTAIQDFVRDSFSTDKEEELESVEVGQFTVWVERGPHAALACVIRGNAPRTLRQLMQEQLETIHARHAPLLEQFAGDNSDLLYCKPLIEETLRSELKPEAKPRWMTPQLAILLGIILLVGSVWGYVHLEYQRRLNNYLHALYDTPGVVVTLVENEGSKTIIHGLRDPLAALPHKIAERFQLSEKDVLFKEKPYLDLGASFLERRVRQWLKPPNTVQLTLKGDVVHLQGHADQGWIDRMSDRVGMLIGVNEVDTSKLVNTDAQFQAYLKVLKEIPGIMVVSNGIKNGQRVVTGMRDPLADDPDQLARRMQLEDIVTTWRPYQDMTPQFIEKRVIKRINPPPAVTVAMQGEILSLRGHATIEWITKALEQGRTVPGVTRIVADELIDSDQFLLAEAQHQLSFLDQVKIAVHQRVLQVQGEVDSTTFQKLQQQLQEFKKSHPELIRIDTVGLLDAEQEVEKLAKDLEQLKIYFAEDTAWLPNQEGKLKTLLKNMQRLIELNQKLQKIGRLQLTGNTDGVGTEIYNKDLSLRRAQSIFDWLSMRKIRKELMIIVPPTVLQFGESDPIPTDRNVSFKVIRDRELTE